MPSHEGYLRVHLRGAIDTDLAWRDDQLLCEGAARPDGHGRRVVFSGTSGEHHVRIVFGFDGARDARDVPVNLTLIFEGERRWYATAGDDKCRLEQLHVGPWQALGAHRWRLLSARGYCVEPARALVGAVDAGQALAVPRFDFAGEEIE